MRLAEEIEQMFDREMQLGGRAARQYALLSSVRRKELPVDGLPSYLIFNPGRVHSVMADVSPDALAHRQCFLCPEGLEDKQQTYVWQRYHIRVNPFPIFHHHFTISSCCHEPQLIAGHYRDMLLLAAELPEYAIFYNGPRCGASAPDHMHFQAVPIDALPLQAWCDQHIAPSCSLTVSKVGVFCPSAYLLCSESPDGMDEKRAEMMARLGRDVNIVTWVAGGFFKSLIIFRSKSRPDCFFAEDPQERILISPATVEMCGIAIVASEEAFCKLDAPKLKEIIREVSLTL